MGVEFELKYACSWMDQDAVMNHINENWHPISMETTYYDTPSGALSEKHYTLRRRLENGVSICTVKTPLASGARGEWETECDDIHAAIPELCKLGAPADLAVLASESLEAVCGARFRRQACTVHFMGAVLEIALDHGVLFGGSREIPLCETEVELKSGPKVSAILYARHLAKKFHMEPQPKSKFRRALELREG